MKQFGILELLGLESSVLFIELTPQELTAPHSKIVTLVDEIYCELHCWQVAENSAKMATKNIL